MSSVPRDGSDRKGPAETAGWKKTDAAKVSSSPSKAKEKHDGSSVSSLDKSKSRGKSKNSHGGDPMMKDSHRGSPVMKTAKSKHDSSVKGGEKRTAPEERGSPTVVKKAKTATQMLVVSVDVEPKEEENDGDEDLTGDETEKVGNSSSMLDENGSLEPKRTEKVQSGSRAEAISDACIKIYTELNQMLQKSSVAWSAEERERFRVFVRTLEELLIKLRAVERHNPFMEDEVAEVLTNAQRQKRDFLQASLPDWKDRIALADAAASKDSIAKRERSDKESVKSVGEGLKLFTSLKSCDLKLPLKIGNVRTFFRELASQLSTIKDSVDKVWLELIKERIEASENGGTLFNLLKAEKAGSPGQEYSVQEGREFILGFYVQKRFGMAAIVTALEKVKALESMNSWHDFCLAVTNWASDMGLAPETAEGRPDLSAVEGSLVMSIFTDKISSILHSEFFKMGPLLVVNTFEANLPYLLATGEKIFKTDPTLGKGIRAVGKEKPQSFDKGFVEVKASSKSSRRKEKAKTGLHTCMHCKKMVTHGAAECYENPEVKKKREEKGTDKASYADREKVRNERFANNTCFNCNKPGHQSRECPEAKEKKAESVVPTPAAPGRGGLGGARGGRGGFPGNSRGGGRGGRRSRTDDQDAPDDNDIDLMVGNDDGDIERMEQRGGRGVTQNWADLTEAVEKRMAALSPPARTVMYGPSLYAGHREKKRESNDSEESERFRADENSDEVDLLRRRTKGPEGRLSLIDRDPRLFASEYLPSFEYLRRTIHESHENDFSLSQFFSENDRFHLSQILTKWKFLVGTTNDFKEESKNLIVHGYVVGVLEGVDEKVHATLVEMAYDIQRILEEYRMSVAGTLDERIEYHSKCAGKVRFLTLLLYGADYDQPVFASSLSTIKKIIRELTLLRDREIVAHAVVDGRGTRVVHSRNEKADGPKPVTSNSSRLSGLLQEREENRERRKNEEESKLREQAKGSQKKQIRSVAARGNSESGSGSSSSRDKSGHAGRDTDRQPVASQDKSKIVEKETSPIPVEDVTFGVRAMEIEPKPVEVKEKVDDGAGVQETGMEVETPGPSVPDDRHLHFPQIFGPAP